MIIIRTIKNFVQFFTEGFIEIFSPNHDHYPAVGIQPYAGTVNYRDNW